MIYNTASKTVKTEGVQKGSIGALVLFLCAADYILSIGFTTEKLVQLSTLSTLLIVTALVADWLVLYVITYRNIAKIPEKDEKERWQEIITMRRRRRYHDKAAILILAISVTTSLVIYSISQIDLQWISHEAIMWIIVFPFMSRDIIKMGQRIEVETAHCDLLKRVSNYSS